MPSSHRAGCARPAKLSKSDTFAPVPAREKHQEVGRVNIWTPVWAPVKAASTTAPGSKASSPAILNLSFAPIGT